LKHCSLYVAPKYFRKGEGLNDKEGIE